MSQLKAKPHCCEEANLWSSQTYIPCNAPAANIVGWKGRQDAPIRMCKMCTDHNVNNRGGYVVRPYTEGLLHVNQEMQSLNPWDSMNEDQLLILWQNKKMAIAQAQADEMDLRKYIVKREFPKPNEGTNRKELGAGFDLKAVVKFNYNLADNDTVETTLNKLSKMGNEGMAIADRLVSWKPSFLKTEYRKLQEDAEKGSQFATTALSIINEMLTIKEAAPELEIIAPKEKKK